MTDKRVFGMAWYREQDYRRILEIMEDADIFPKTYKRWKYLTRRREIRLKAAGWSIVRAIIEPEKFLTWTEGQGVNAGLHARARYASLAATQIPGGT